jgi:uncharacterized protein
MADSILGITEIELFLPVSTSLKEKRSTIKSMLTRVRQTFNVTAAEVAYLDKWQTAKIAIAAVSNSAPHVRETLQNVQRWIEAHYPEAVITRAKTELR